jgi:hypothetical protein
MDGRVVVDESTGRRQLDRAGGDAASGYPIGSRATAYHCKQTDRVVMTGRAAHSAHENACQLRFRQSRGKTHFTEHNRSPQSRPLQQQP